MANVNWIGEERFTCRDIGETPDIRHYYLFQPDRGDFGFVAEQSGLTLGVVWALFFDQPDPGYGYVQKDIPVHIGKQ